jgi:hypothetical protein
MDDHSWATEQDERPCTRERVGEHPWVRTVSLVDDRETDRRMRRLVRRRRSGTGGF